LPASATDDDQLTVALRTPAAVALTPVGAAGNPPTVTDALACCVSNTAVMVLVPGASAATRPLLERSSDTAAMRGLDEVHEVEEVTLAVDPSANLATAMNSCVCPTPRTLEPGYTDSEVALVAYDTVTLTSAAVDVAPAWVKNPTCTPRSSKAVSMMAYDTPPSSER
jgi:hypothetical protein